MAFDQATRNRLQKFVGDARKLLSEEFTQQLQNTYGLDPVTGSLADVTNLPALNPGEQQTATLLRDTLDHYLAGSLKAEPYKDKSLVIATLDRIVREQAFTVLNRLAAIRMAEARQFIIESIGQGYQSNGFKLFHSIAGSSLGETGQSYQHYLFSMFDELSLDLAVLFDRYSNQGRLFPRESVLLELLDLINHAELEMLWSEDETIGWIYQYFNDPIERKQMRDLKSGGSQAPRNSRELAVRNQFFTPRYIVEFLTDNTLGRIWYEMTKGKTTLVDLCQYLIRRPNEIFIESGIDTTGISLQDNTVPNPVYIKHRPIKDPRDITILDPACGSMHFGLYAYDILERIYSEAWDIESEKGRDAFHIDHTEIYRDGLHETYLSKEAFLADVPRLIIENNIHGIDIDSRAAQIAGLCLWLRAQKSWADNATHPSKRSQIKRSNIVCAEPMPGEKTLLSEFTREVQPRVLGQLVEEIFDKMHLAGEAGSLLKIEEEIQEAIDDAKSQKDDNVLEVQGSLFGENKWEVQEGKRYYNFGDVSEDFWSNAEQLILSQLERYSGSTNSSSQKHLFALDAAKGFSFIDLCRKRFDVVLMNPPFGAPALSTVDYMKDNYPTIKTDLYGAFVTNGVSRLKPNGLLGALTSRTGFFLASFEKWRINTFIDHSSLSCMVDLGRGVLDGAMVETAAYIINTNPADDKESLFFRLSDDVDKSSVLKDQVKTIDSRIFVKSASTFKALPKTPFCYWLKPKVSHKISTSKRLDPDNGRVIVGVQTDNDFRFVRLWFEVNKSMLGKNCSDSYQNKPWISFLKGDTSNPFYLDHNLVINWSDNGEELRAATENAPGGRVNNESDYYKPGISWTLRTDHFVPHLVPRGCIPSVSRYQYIPNSESDSNNIYTSLSLLSSDFCNFVAKLQMERWQHPKYIPGVIKSLPLPDIDGIELIQSISKSGALESFRLLSSVETNRRFYFPLLIGREKKSNEVTPTLEHELRRSTISSVIKKHKKINDLVFSSYDLVSDDIEISTDDNIDSFSIKKKYLERTLNTEFLINEEQQVESVFSWIVGVVFGRWSIESSSKIFSLDEIDLLEAYDQETPAQLGTKYSHASKIIPVDINDKRGFDSKINNVIEELPENSSINYYLNEILDERLGSIGILLKKPSLYFDKHLKEYSASKRYAPIYWQLKAASGDYTLWVYYHSLNEQTLFECVNNYIDPKLNVVTQDITSLQKNTHRTSNDERKLTSLTEVAASLKDFRDELLRIAQFWKPNLSDGVQINAAPLWKLFQHKTWRKKLEKTWGELEQGKYDWSHMAYNIWPERVLNKCRSDRSIAIAHNVEGDLWEKIEAPALRGRGTKTVWQPKAFTEAELDAYIKMKTKE